MTTTTSRGEHPEYNPAGRRERRSSALPLLRGANDL